MTTDIREHVEKTHCNFGVLPEPSWRWLICFALVVGLHIGLIWLSRYRTSGMPPVPNFPPPAVLLDLAPPAIPSPKAAEESPPAAARDAPKSPSANRPVSHSSPPKAVARVRSAKPETSASRPYRASPTVSNTPRAAISSEAEATTTSSETPSASAEHQEQRAGKGQESAAGSSSATTTSGSAARIWQGELLGRLEQFKRYPPQAQLHHQQGIVYLRFTMNHEGMVLSAQVEKTSGHGLLDREAQALVMRAQPLPKPPSEMSSDPIELVVPIAFFMSGQS